MSFHREILISVVHLNVPTHENTLPVFDYLQGHDQRYWYKVAKHQTGEEKRLAQIKAVTKSRAAYHLRED